MSRQKFFKVFDAVVQPTHLYASEVWEFLHDNSPVQKVHLFACKKLLNVFIHTPSDTIYGKLGWYHSYLAAI